MWMVLGVPIGVVATLLIKQRDSGLYAANITLGSIGGLFGGIAGSVAGIVSMSDFTWLSMAPAGAGAVLLIGLYLLAKRPRRY
jgi:uncharacterized membrane protein YeaQ/YmgE (transglycosylase-associated protein family)